jgi:hypothetical protein
MTADYQTQATHAATTARKRGTNLVRCPGCGHSIGQRSLMTTVRWWNDNYTLARLRVDRYHAECAPPFDSARVLLYKPGFEWREWATNGSMSARLVPCQPDNVVDMVTMHSITDSNRRCGNGAGFFAQATYSDRPYRHMHAGWHVHTRGCGHGSSRYTWYATEQEARDHLVKWYARRYRYADVVTPDSEMTPEEAKADSLLPSP